MGQAQQQGDGAGQHAGGHARTGKHKADPHERSCFCVSPLGLHADVHELPSRVRLEHLGLAGRQDAGEGIPCAPTPSFSAFTTPLHQTP